MNRKYWFNCIGLQKNIQLVTSFADPECLSRILMFTHPGSKNSNKREG
jgi:hypothetical protein